MPKPFKGHLYYEWQIGPVVLQFPVRNSPAKLRFWRPIWIDHYWFNRNSR